MIRSLFPLRNILCPARAICFQRQTLQQTPRRSVIESASFLELSSSVAACRQITHWPNEPVESVRRVLTNRIQCHTEADRLLTAQKRQPAAAGITVRLTSIDRPTEHDMAMEMSETTDLPDLVQRSRNEHCHCRQRGSQLRPDFISFHQLQHHATTCPSENGGKCSPERRSHCRPPIRPRKAIPPG